MASPAPGTWRFLPLSASSGIPVLLVSVEMGLSNYAIRVSDMANIWEESLDRKAICMRGWSENTSIDPSDTAENMSRFLSSLKTALDPTQTGYGETSLSLAPATSSDAGEDGITLRITCPLPGFESLQWPVHLRKQPPSTVATALVLPMIQAHFERKQEMQSLIQMITDRDSVVTKLSDKLEAMGTGLEHVFTALSGRKKVTRAAAEDRVKGLKPFNERRWKKELDSDNAAPSSVNELLQHVFGDTGLYCRSAMDVDVSPELDRWWHDFLPTSQSSQQNRHKISSSKRQPDTPPPKSTNCDDEDDFQIQSTPPHLRPASKGAATGKVSPPPEDDVSTEGQEDSVEPHSDPSSPLPDRRRQPEPKPNNSRLGAIGGGKHPVSPRQLSPTPKSRTVKPPENDEETASEASDDDAMTSLPASSPVPPPQKEGPKKGGLGRIGAGASKTESVEKDKAPNGHSPAKARETNSKKLGTIGGKASKSLKQEDEDTSRGRPATRRTISPAEEQPRETSEERADRKREELKRELERKAAAGPAKKKRRF